MKNVNLLDIIINALDFEDYHLKDLQEDKILDLIVKNVKNIEAQYEKFILCYNIVKKFKNTRKIQDQKKM